MRDCPDQENHDALVRRFLGHCTVCVRYLGSVFTQPCILHVGILEVAFTDEDCINDLAGEEGQSWQESIAERQNQCKERLEACAKEK